MDARDPNDLKKLSWTEKVSFNLEDSANDTQIYVKILDTAPAGGKPEVIASGLIDLVKAKTFLANNKGKYKQTVKVTLETN